MREELRAALETAMEAARLAREAVRGSDSRERYKHGRSLSERVVTAADEASAQVIGDYLRKTPYNLHIEDGQTIPKGSAHTWYVDPLDGTWNHGRGLPSAVSIGLAREGRPVVGVILPLSGEDAYWAAEGTGAHQGASSIACRPTPMYLTGGVPESPRAVEERLFTVAGDFRHLGCTSMALALIARGDAGIFYGAVEPHDACAGAVILSEAGGRTGNPTPPWSVTDTLLLAGEATLYDAGLAALTSSHGTPAARRRYGPR